MTNRGLLDEPASAEGEPSRGVAGTTKVWVRKNSTAQLIAIKDICALDDGEYETIAVDRRSLRLCWKRVARRLTCVGDDKPWLRISLERGQVLDASKNLALFTLDENGELLPTPTSQLRIGIPIVVPFDLSDLVDTSAVDLTTLDLRSVAPLASRRAATSTVDVEGSLTNRLRRTRFPLDLPLSDDFLRIVGLWIAEGGKDPESKSKSLAFSIGGLTGAPELLRRYFTAYGASVSKSSANNFDYCVNSSVAYEVFRRLDLFGTAKAGSKRFPTWFWRLSQRQRRIVVAGLWDGDGCQVWIGEAPISQRSHAIIRELYHCFLLDGIFCTIKSSAHSQLRLAISRSTDMTRFVSLYPLWHAAKRQTLINARSVRGRDKTTGLWKFERIWKTVASATLPPGQKTKIYNSGGRYDNSVRAQRTAFASVPSLRPLVDSKLAFLRVTALAPVQHQMMYDLEVEDARNFVADGLLACCR